MCSFSYHMIFVSFNSNTWGATSGAGTAFFLPEHLISLCFFCFLSAVLSAILCLFVLFFVCSSSSYGIFVYLFIVMMKTHLDLLQTQLNLYKHVVSPIPASDEAY